MSFTRVMATTMADPPIPTRNMGTSTWDRPRINKSSTEPLYACLLCVPGEGLKGADARLHAMRMLLNRRVMLAVLLSSLLQIIVFPVAGPLPLWRTALAWFALVPLLWALLPRGAVWSPLQAACIGYASGILWYMGTCYWVYSTMHLYGSLSVPMSALVMVLFCLYLGLYHALFGFLISVARRGGTAFALCAAPLLWIGVELARARITSFPWDLLGYSQVDNALLTRLAPITGVYGISFVLAVVNAAFAAVVVFPRRRVPATAALVAAVIATGVQNFGSWFRPPVYIGSQKAVLMQPNLDVGSGGDAPVAVLAPDFAGLTLQAAQLDGSPVRIALWPESPAPFQTDRAEFTSVMSTLSKQLGAPVIAGSVGVDADPMMQRGYRMYNSAALFTPEQGYAGRYDKMHLVPFGEYVPYADLFSFASGLTQAVGTSDRGTSREPLLAAGHRYGAFMCYESIFADEVRLFVRNGAEVLTNLSDDGWYGDTSAPFQHINMARMRAIENRRWVLRDTNNGITASIDPNGRVVESMARHRRGAVAVHFDYRTETTFYTQHGDVFAYICTLLALGCLGYAVVRPSASEKAGIPRLKSETWGTHPAVPDAEDDIAVD